MSWSMEKVPEAAAAEQPSAGAKELGAGSQEAEESLLAKAFALLERRRQTLQAPRHPPITRTLHTFPVWAAIRSVPTGELRCECSFRVGGSGRRPLESADPGGGRVGPYERDGSRMVVLDRV